MSNVLNKNTKQYLTSKNTPDYKLGGKFYDNGVWIINPILPVCDPSEWVIEGDTVRETTQDEKDAKIAEKAAKEAEKLAQELLDKEKADADKIKARKDFLKLTLEEQVLYLYDRQI